MFSSTSSALPSKASSAGAHAHQGLLDESVLSPSLPAQCALSLPMSAMKGCLSTGRTDRLV